MDPESTKKKRTGKPGRPPRHGGYSIMNRGDLLERRPHVRAYLTGIREGLIRDLGPREQDLTTAQLALVNHVISKLGVLRLIEEHIQAQGVFTSDGLLDPALGKFWLAGSNSLRLDLMALGIHTRKGEEGLSLEKYINLKAEEAAAPAASIETTGGQGQGLEEIGAPGASERDSLGMAPDPGQDQAPVEIAAEKCAGRKGGAE